MRELAAGELLTLQMRQKQKETGLTTGRMGVHRALPGSGVDRTRVTSVRASLHTRGVEDSPGLMGEGKGRLLDSILSEATGHLMCLPTQNERLGLLCTQK